MGKNEHTEKEPFVFINGAIVKKSKARISPFDRGLIYGDGAFEAIRYYNDRLFRFHDHMERLRKSLSFLKIQLPRDEDFIENTILDLLKRSELSRGYVRIIVTRGVSATGIDPRNATVPSLMILVERREPLFLSKESVTAKISSTIQPPIGVLDPRMKTLNYLNKVIAKMDAIESGYDVPILLNSLGEVTECGTENIFIARNGELVTPAIDSGLLPGITRDTVLRIASDLGIKATERVLYEDDLYDADEVFATGTAIGIIPIREVSGKQVARFESFEMTMKLQSIYHNSISGNGIEFSKPDKEKTNASTQ